MTSPATPTDDLLIDSFNKPKRKDRHHDNHGGGMINIVHQKMNYITNADQTLAQTPLNTSGLNLSININMFFWGFSIDTLTTIIHIFFA